VVSGSILFDTRNPPRDFPGAKMLELTFLALLQHEPSFAGTAHTRVVLAAYMPLLLAALLPDRDFPRTGPCTAWQEFSELHPELRGPHCAARRPVSRGCFAIGSTVPRRGRGRKAGRGSFGRSRSARKNTRDLVEGLKVTR